MIHGVRTEVIPTFTSFATQSRFLLLFFYTFIILLFSDITTDYNLMTNR